MATDTCQKGDTIGDNENATWKRIIKNIFKF